MESSSVLDLKSFPLKLQFEGTKADVGGRCCLCPPRMINSDGGLFPRPLLGVDGKQMPNGAVKREALPG